MRRTIKWVMALGSIAIGVAAISPRVSGQLYLGASPPQGSWAAQPTTKDGEWPSYNGDIHGTRYSPLDQINGTNFNKLEVAWRFKTDNLGPRAEYKLEGTPIMVKGVLYTTAGVRRSVVALDGKTGEVLWTHTIREGKRAVVSPRQLSGRGLSYWTDGRGDDRVVYFTTGYRMIELNAHTGAMISSFGTNGVVDLKQGVVYGNRQPIDLETGEIGLHSTPAIAKDVIVVGSSFREGQTVPTHNNTKGLVRGLRCADRQAALDLQHDSTPRRIRQRNVGKRFVVDQRQHRRLDPDFDRRGCQPGLSAGRNTFVRLLRRPSSRQQPFRRIAGRGRPSDGSAEVALPVRPPSDLEFRQCRRRRF